MLSEEGQSERGKKKIIIWSIVGGIILLGVLIFAGVYSGLLGARFAPGLPFNITGPDELVAGEPTIVTWDTSPENQQQYPSDKIEFCRGRFFGERCVTLNIDTTNDGEALVFVPDVEPGAGYLRLTARNRPGGDLLPHASMTRPVTVVAAGSQAANRIAPVNVGSGSIGTLTAAGPRIGVSQGGTYTVVLPEPSATKKIEICQHGGRCYTLASSIKGSNAQVRIPNINLGKAFLKISERGANGTLTGREFFRRAVAVAPPTASPVTNESNEQGDSGDGGSDNQGGGGGGNSNGNNDNKGKKPEPAVASAQFLVPVDEEVMTLGDPLDVRVKLIATKSNQVTCQEWLLDGVPITSSQWQDSQSPDLSATPCQ